MADRFVYALTSMGAIILVVTLVLFPLYVGSWLMGRYQKPYRYSDPMYHKIEKLGFIGIGVSYLIGFFILLMVTAPIHS